VQTQPAPAANPLAPSGPIVVQFGTGDAAWFLRGTTVTGDRDRANVFADADAAQVALGKARKFMKPAAFKAARMVPA